MEGWAGLVLGDHAGGMLVVSSLGPAGGGERAAQELSLPEGRV